MASMSAAAESLPRAPVTRFAPSPTGELHLGNARTALFNFLLARHAGGRFLLRIEDTDAERSLETHTRRRCSRTCAGSASTGMPGPDREDERGPYRQSQRGALYARYLRAAGASRAPSTRASARPGARAVARARSSPPAGRRATPAPAASSPPRSARAVRPQGRGATPALSGAARASASSSTDFVHGPQSFLSRRHRRLHRAPRRRLRGVLLRQRRGRCLHGGDATCCAARIT